MRIDHAGQDVLAGRVDLTFGGQPEVGFADGNDPSVPNANVRRRDALRRDDRAAMDEQV